EVDGEIQHATGSGNGGFDAFIHAMNEVMASRNYVLPTLVDYEVRIPKGGHANALTECVITWDCDGQDIKTRGVHSNQVFAGILAALRVVNLQLHERESGATVVAAPLVADEQA